jgi:membrane metallo-endopeptidase-like protein 1
MVSQKMDRGVKPCDDFFQFACGNWRKKTIIPEDRSSIDTFRILRDEVEVTLKSK